MTDQIEKQIKDEAIAVLHKIITEVGETPEFKKLKIEVIQKTLAGWAGHSIFKKAVSNRMVRKLEHELLEAELAPKTDIREMELWENIGKLITLGSKFMAQKDRTNPHGVAEFLEMPLKKILMNTDFSDIFKMVKASEARELSTQKMIQDIMTQFSSKAEIFPAIKLKKADTNLKKKSLILQNMGNMPPEMFESTMTNLLNILIELTATVGENINTWSRLINRIHELQPEIGLSTVSPLFSVIDWDELQAAVQRLMPDISESVKPVVRTVMPELINRLCEFLRPAPGEDHDALAEALANLRYILSNNWKHHERRNTSDGNESDHSPD